MTTLYGISNCDTIRKARRWLQANSIDYRFHDVRTDGISKAMLSTWMQVLDWESLLNRRSSSWRQLPAETREQVDRKVALRLMLEHPAIIKRPVLEHNNHLHLGFSDERYAAIFHPDAST
ncbi:MAG: ArsC family reductase [Gammaproteobacteria bacterium]|jgi:arsenate reductase|nr:ArsC family reductase [Gammaproteobacteria bacterium]